MLSTIFLAADKTVPNQIILALEIVMLVVSILMIVIGMIQNKTSQTGLSALNGGNEELFSNSKERGWDKIFSNWMMVSGIIFFVITLIICILTNTILK